MLRPMRMRRAVGLGRLTSAARRGERVLRGERLIVTRDGAPVAEMRARPRTAPSPAELVARRRRLPLIDPDALRRDLDEVIDATL